MLKEHDVTKDNGTDPSILSTEEKYHLLIDRYNSLVTATEEINKKYVASLETNEVMSNQLTGLRSQLEIKQNALQFLANEQNDQERRHAGQIEEIMVEVRELRGQLNGNIDNVGN